VLVVAIIGIGVGLVGWFRPMPHTNAPLAPPQPIYTEQQIADAKSHVCDAYSVAKNEVASNTSRPNPIEGDEIGAIAVGTNGRLALYVGGDYLLDQLAAEPATPVDLVNHVRSLANSYKKIAINALNNEPNSALDPLRHAIDSDIMRIDGLCK
jgi:hypothetical protein